MLLVFFSIGKSEKRNIFTSYNSSYLFQFFPCKFSCFHALRKSRLTNPKLFCKFCNAYICMNTGCFDLFLYCNNYHHFLIKIRTTLLYIIFKPFSSLILPMKYTIYSKSNSSFILSCVKPSVASA